MQRTSMKSCSQLESCCQAVPFEGVAQDLCDDIVPAKALQSRSSRMSKENSKKHILTDL